MNHSRISFKSSENRGVPLKAKLILAALTVGSLNIALADDAWTSEHLIIERQAVQEEYEQAYSDTRIKRRVQEALQRDPIVDVYKINVNVQNRVVTLSGTVDSTLVKNDAAIVARAVSGVTRLVNQIRVREQTANAPDLHDVPGSARNQNEYERPIRRRPQDLDGFQRRRSIPLRPNPRPNNWEGWIYNERLEEGPGGNINRTEIAENERSRGSLEPPNPEEDLSDSGRAAAPPGSVGGSSASPATGEGKRRSVEIIAKGYQFTPSQIAVQAGEILEIKLVNVGDATHGIEFELPGRELSLGKRVTPGSQVSMRVAAPAKPGTYLFYCPVGNHKENGMTGLLIVRD